MSRNAFIFDDVRIAPEGQIGWHAHSSWELSYVAFGAGVRTIGDLTEPIQQGEIILIPPDIPHEWRFDPGVTDEDGNIANISVFFEGGLLDSMRELFPEMANHIENIESQNGVLFYTGEAHDEIRGILLSMRGLSADRRFPRMMELLMALSDTADSRSVGSNNLLSRSERRFEQVRIYCACNYSRKITLEEMSRHVGMNKSAFCTFMSRYAGTTLSEYVNDVRLEMAVEKLLNTDCNVGEIAADCGFQNVTYFNRLFKSRYKLSPREMRASVK